MSPPALTEGPTRVAIVGGGGFARETLDVIEAHNRVHPHLRIGVVGVLDANIETSARELLAARGIEVLGSDEDWPDDDPTISYLLCLGDPATRRRVGESFRNAGRRSHPGVVHPDAGVGTAVVFGEGTVICAGAQVSTNVKIGRQVHVNPNATVGHDSVIAAYSSLNPGSVISGHVEIGEAVLVGAGAVVLENVKVGAGAVIGAAACVVRDVGAKSIVKGVPAR